jgi:hypothetical protein
LTQQRKIRAKGEKLTWGKLGSHPVSLNYKWIFFGGQVQKTIDRH